MKNKRFCDLNIGDNIYLKIDNRNRVIFNIQDIDTSRNWCLVEYDNSLDVKYLDCEDKSLNYWGVI